MSDRDLDERVREALEAASVPRGSLALSILSEIEGRGARRRAVLDTLRLLPGATAVVALSLVVLVIVSSALASRPPLAIAPAREFAVGDSAPAEEGEEAPIVVRFEEELDYSSPSTVLTALFIEGMSP